MTRPTQSIKYVQKKYQTYQSAAIIFVLITVLTALFAVISGFQVVKLRKVESSYQKAASHPITDESDTLKQQVIQLNAQIDEQQQQLNAEIRKKKSLINKVATLEKQLATGRHLKKE